MIRARIYTASQTAVLVASGFLLCVLVLSCGTTREERKETDVPSSVAKASVEISETCNGNGEGETLATAMNQAKVDAIRAYVRALVGSENEEKNKGKIQQALYNVSNTAQFVFNDSLVVNSRTSAGSLDLPKFAVGLTVKVNKGAISQTLRTLGLSVALPESAAVNSTTTPINADVSTATDAQKSFIRKYVDRLTYLVYFGDKTNEKDAFLLKAAISQANSYLASMGYTAIDSSQVEKLKKDKGRIYEDQSGGQVSLIQWIAQSLNADVYLEIDASTTSESRGGGNYYAQAIVTVKMFETSTGQLLGSAPFNSPKILSKVDETDALSNALQSSVYSVMPTVVEQSKSLLAKQFSNGIRYEITVQKASDARVISNLRSKLRKLPNVSEISTRNQNTDEVVYDVYYYGKIDDLMDAILDASGSITGLENLDLVLVRGKTMIFNSGL